MEDASAVSRDAGNPPVRFDVAGAGDRVMDPPKRARSRKRLTQPRGVLQTTAPVPDPTGPHALLLGPSAAQASVVAARHRRTAEPVGQLEGRGVVVETAAAIYAVIDAGRFSTVVAWNADG